MFQGTPTPPEDELLEDDEDELEDEEELLLELLELLELEEELLDEEELLVTSLEDSRRTLSNTPLRTYGVMERIPIATLIGWPTMSGCAAVSMVNVTSVNGADVLDPEDGNVPSTGCSVANSSG